MNILQINKYNYVKGGAERYYIKLCELLKRKGHKVARFSVKDDSNLPSGWDKYFISNISFDEIRLVKAPETFARMLYSLEARKKINLLLNEFVPDIVHIHNIYNHISPSIFAEINKRNIPIIQTVHDYHLISPNVNLFHKGSICEKTRIHEVMLHRCIKNSYFASGATALVFALHKFFKIYSKNIDIFITPSKFARKKLIAAGFDEKRIYYFPHFVGDGGSSTNLKKSYVLFFGSLYEHKGVEALLKAAKALPTVRFKIAGDGPEEESPNKLAKSLKLANVEFLGRLNSQKLKKAIMEASFCVVPSLWYEPSSYSILESFAYGKSVIASRIGGIPEIINDGDNGVLFTPGNADELSKKIKKLWENPKLVESMGKKAKGLVRQRYNPEKHYLKLMKIYKKAIKAIRDKR